MSDYRKFDRRKKPRKKRFGKDSFNNIFYRSKRSIDEDLNVFFAHLLTKKAH